MTILDVRNMFTTNTEITVKSLEENSPTIKVTNLLLGCTVFNSISILNKSIKAVTENQIEITIDIPTPVLEAWKKYSDYYYSNN